MPPEELNALEMIRDMVDGKLDLANESDECLNDIWIAAQIALREHPADDDETVTESWVCESFAFGDTSYANNQKRYVIFGDGLRLIAFATHGPKCWDWSLWCGKMKVKDDPTRGDVRRLCRALGIELKEPT